MNPRSLAMTLPGIRTTRAATLNNYRRKANITFAGYAYMNIVPDSTVGVQGVLIQLTEEELSVFALREEGYAMIDVTNKLSPREEVKTIAFIAPNIPCSLKVPRSYLDTCTGEMSADEREKWIQETELAGIEEDADAPIYEFKAE